MAFHTFPLTSVPVCFSVAGVKHCSVAFWEKGVYSDYRFQSILKGSQDKTLRAGSEHGGRLLAVMLSLVCSATFFIQSRLTYPGMAVPPPPVWVDPLLSVINEGSTPQSCLQDSLMETTLQLKFPDVLMFPVDNQD